MSRPAVFLDRDGVINASIVRDGKPFSPQTPDELVVLPGVEAALAKLRDAGFVRVIVTNQPDVARGKLTRDGLDAMHAKLRPLVDAIYACTHDDVDRCACRKPAPGMLTDAARDLGLDLARSIMVGDRWRDIEAGIAAGCRTVYVDHGYDERRPASFDFTAKSLADATDWICASRS